MARRSLKAKETDFGLEVGVVMKEFGEEGQSNQKRLLVIDDDMAIRKTSAEVLERAGFLVDCAEDGEQGWQAVSAEAYDLVVTDQQMPRLTGFDLLCRMRAAGMNCPVIMVTGSTHLDDRLIEVFDAVLHKPFFLYELVVTVQRVLSQNTRLQRKKLIHDEANNVETAHSN
jgi:DNA-binding response OmpR family regulator